VSKTLRTTFDRLSYAVMESNAPCIMPQWALGKLNCFRIGGGGVLASESWQESWRPSPKVQPGGYIMIKDKDGRSQEDFLVVHCFCRWRGGALLGGLFGANRSMECEFLSLILGFFSACFCCTVIVCYYGYLYCIYLIRFLSSMYQLVWFSC